MIDLSDTIKWPTEALRKEREAIEVSLQHWRENARLAKKGELDKMTFGSDHCALCQLHTRDDCEGCSLALAGYECRPDESLYVSIFEAYRCGDAIETYKGAMHLRTVLRGLLVDAERELERRGRKCRSC